MVGGEGAPVGDDRGDPAVLPLDARDGVAVQEDGAAAGGPLHLGAGGEQGAGQTVVGGVEAAEDDRLVDEGPEFLAAGGAHDLAAYAPGGGVAGLAVQVGEALGGGRELQTADRVEAGHSVRLEGVELLHRVLGERREHPGGAGLEHQARRVRGGAARSGQGSLLEDGDVGPAAGGQLVGQGAADDAGADDDDLRTARAGFGRAGHAPPCGGGDGRGWGKRPTRQGR